VRLVGVEIRRLLSRRLFRIMVLLVLVALAFLLGKTAWDSHPPTPAARAAAAAQAREAARQSPPVDEQIRQCKQDQAAGRAPKEIDCAKMAHAPTAADFLQDRTFRFARQMPGLVQGFGVLLALLGFVVGASFVGAEWSAGTMAGLLIWEPRRSRVVVAKVAGLSLVLGAVGVLVMAAHVAGHYGVAQWRGDLTGVTRGLLTSAALTALRGIGLGIVAGLIGLSVAGITRHTSAALGIGFAYFVGAELVLRSLWHGANPWLLTANVGAWLLHGIDVQIPTTCVAANALCEQKVVHLSMARGGAFLGVATALLLAAFTIGFRRRDVT